jgi:signal transduction histidine kinase
MRLNLFGKALLLVGFPLICELGFTCGLFAMVQQLDLKANNEHHSREALASLNSIYERLTESSKLVAVIFTRNGAAHASELHELTGTIPGDLANLRRQLADDPDAMQSLDRLEGDLTASMRILDEVFSQVEDGNRVGAIQHLRDLKHALPDLTQQLNDLRTSCTHTADYAFERQRDERRSIELLLKVAIGFNVVLAIGVAFGINRNITRRLSMVMENTRRVAQGRELMPDVGGGDEIAHLDRVFKDMARALEQAEKERKEMERLKQEFVSMISHDLRTPLTSIQVFLNMLSKGMLGEVSDKTKTKASMADRNATRLIGLINDLLDVDKMESGQLSLACDDSSLRSVIERSIDSVRGVSEQQGVSVESLMEDEVSVFADSDRLVQVMVNLLGNAVKFSEKGSTVKISVLKRGDDVRVEVIDQGRGVPEDLRESIFERFKQVSAKDSTEKKGTGLGLAICKAIVEQHGGKIGCESSVGHGSVFWFTLPLGVKNASLANAAERTKAAVSD